MNENIVAFIEEPVTDMVTGEDFIWRREWRVLHIRDADLEKVNDHFGDNWRRSRPRASHLLEKRVLKIVDGKVVPSRYDAWTPFDVANSERGALARIPDDVTPICPALLKIQQDREAHRLALEKAKKEREEKQRKEAKKKRAVKEGQAAFERLATSKSEKNRKWAIRWNGFVKTASEAIKEKVRSDPGLRELYEDCIIASTVPAKKRAIREFLEAVEE